MTNRLKENSRGAAPILWAILAIVVLITLGVIFLLAPAFFLAGLLILAGLVILIVFKAHPHGLTAGVVVIVIGAALGFLAQGQQLGLALVHGL